MALFFAAVDSLISPLFCGVAAAFQKDPAFSIPTPSFFLRSYDSAATFQIGRYLGAFLDLLTAANNSQFLHSCLKSGAFHSQASGGTAGSCNDPAGLLQSS